MKKLSYLLSLYAIAILGLLSSCGGDEDDPTPAAGPTVTPIASAGFTTANKNVTAGEFVKVYWNAKKGDKDLKTFDVLLNGQHLSAYNPSEGTLKTLTGDARNIYQDSVYFNAPSTNGTYTYTFKAVDTDGKEGSFNIVLTVGASAGELNTINTLILGGQSNNSSGSFYSSTQGVLSQSGAKSNAAAVDFLFFYGASNQATIAAPSDPDAQLVYNNASTGIQTWSAKNATKIMVTALTATEFDAVTTNTALETATTGVAASTSTKANMLTAGKVIAFQTVGGKKGLIKVNSVPNANTGTASFSVKMQK